LSGARGVVVVLRSLVVGGFVSVVWGGHFIWKFRCVCEILRWVEKVGEELGKSKGRRYL
jgi:hypothetical protein